MVCSWSGGAVTEVEQVGEGVVRYDSCEHTLVDEVLHVVDHVACVCEFVCVRICRSLDSVYIEPDSKFASLWSKVADKRPATMRNVPLFFFTCEKSCDMYDALSVYIISLKDDHHWMD